MYKSHDCIDNNATSHKQHDVASTLMRRCEPTGMYFNNKKMQPRCTFIVHHLFEGASQQTHNVATTSLQRRCNVVTLQRRCNDVFARLCVCWASSIQSDKADCLYHWYQFDRKSWNSIAYWNNSNILWAKRIVFIHDQDIRKYTLG